MSGYEISGQELLMSQPRTSPSSLIADDLRTAIVRGHYQPGSRIPTVRDLAKQYGVTRNTAAKAIAKLQHEGHVVGRYGSGVYVQEARQESLVTLPDEEYTSKNYRVPVLTSNPDPVPRKRPAGSRKPARGSRARDEWPTLGRPVHSRSYSPPSVYVQEPVLRTTALYRYYDDQDRLLYIGISDNLLVRTVSHAKGSSFMDFAARSTIERYPTREQAEDAEREAITAESPLFNVQYNDTPDARRRLVDYLIEQGRTDLLMPAVSRG